MGRHKAERVLILFLRVDLVRGAELLDIGGGQAHAFLQFGSDNEAFAFCLCKLRLDITLAADRQGISGHVAAIGPQNCARVFQKVDFRCAFTVGNYQSDAQFADCERPAILNI